MPEKTRAIARKLSGSEGPGNTRTEAERLARIAERAAHAAASYLLTTGRPAPAEWRAKAHNDFVTVVDRTAEALITERLLGAEPDSRILGEELSPSDALDGLTWIVDPLDGTTNFLHGYPWWCVSIGAVIDGDAVAGTIFSVRTQQRYTAWRGGGAWCNGAPLRVSTIDEPSQALIGTGFPFKGTDQLPEYFAQCAEIFPRTAGVRRAGAAALDMAAVAAGEFDAFWELTLAPWDMAAGMVLIREAGGVVTNLDGAPATVQHGGVVAGNPAMHEWLLARVRRP